MMAGAEKFALVPNSPTGVAALDPTSKLLGNARLAKPSGYKFRQF
jgi:hypothetical protein